MGIVEDFGVALAGISHSSIISGRRCFGGKRKQLMEVSPVIGDDGVLQLSLVGVPLSVGSGDNFDAHRTATPKTCWSSSWVILSTGT